MKKILLIIGLAICMIPSADARRWVPKITASGGGSLTTNLVAYYKLDEASGASATDEVSGLNLTNNGTVGTGTGVINSARTSSGSSTNFLSRASNAAFSPGGSSFFITMWVKGSTTQTGNVVFISKNDVTGNLREWTVGVDNATFAVKLTVSADGVTSAGVVSTSALPDANYHFIAAGWDGTNLMISMDGAAFTTASWTTALFTGAADFRLFMRGGATNSFAGSVEELAIWKGRCLTITEVQSIYNSGAGLPYSSF